MPKINNELTPDFWNKKYQEGYTGWDIGYPSTPLRTYIDQLTDKGLRILVPGAGNGHEVKYLAEKGFSDITVIDWAKIPVQRLRKSLEKFESCRILQDDYFAHQGEYDLILEQTFFCALPPEMRSRYVQHSHDLLVSGGHLAGVLFDCHFNKPGPPFGGDSEEYLRLFSPVFEIKHMEKCYNSIPPRAGNEIFIKLIKTQATVSSI